MPLAADYVATIATQIGGVSAFLGGFAATFLAMLLTLGHRSRAASVAIHASALAGVSFIVTVVATTVLVAVLHPHAPPGAAAGAMRAQFAMWLSFTLGMLALLTAFGASGWTRSSPTGWATSAVAAIGAVCSLFLLMT